MAVYFKRKRIGQGIGKSIHEAEVEAAKNALKTKSGMYNRSCLLLCICAHTYSHRMLPQQTCFQYSINTYRKSKSSVGIKQPSHKTHQLNVLTMSKKNPWKRANAMSPMTNQQQTSMTVRNIHVEKKDQQPIRPSQDKLIIRHIETTMSAQSFKINLNPRVIPIRYVNLNISNCYCSNHNYNSNLIISCPWIEFAFQIAFQEVISHHNRHNKCISSLTTFQVNRHTLFRNRIRMCDIRFHHGRSIWTECKQVLIYISLFHFKIRCT